MKKKKKKNEERNGIVGCVPHPETHIRQARFKISFLDRMIFRYLWLTFVVVSAAFRLKRLEHRSSSLVLRKRTTVAHVCAGQLQRVQVHLVASI
jgi:hypothetical protein